MVTYPLNIQPSRTFGPKGPKGDTGNTGAQGEAGSGAAITVVASADIPAFSVITINGQRADSSNLAHITKVMGITKAAVLTGFPVEVATEGEIENVSWTWNVGDVLYLNGTALSIV